MLKATLIPSSNTLTDVVWELVSAYKDAIKRLAQRTRTIRKRLRITREEVLCQAFEQGFQDGRREALTETFRSMVESQQKYASLIRTANEDCLNLVFSIARQVIQENISTNPSTLMTRIHSGLSRLANKNSLMIRFNPDDLSQIDPNLKLNFSEAGIEVAGDYSITRGNAVITGVTGMVELSWEKQFELIKENLLDQMKKNLSDTSSINKNGSSNVNSF